MFIKPKKCKGCNCDIKYGQKSYYGFCDRQCHTLHKDTILLNRKGKYQYKTKQLNKIEFINKNGVCLVIEGTQYHKAYYKRTSGEATNYWLKKYGYK